MPVDLTDATAMDLHRDYIDDDIETNMVTGYGRQREAQPIPETLISDVATTTHSVWGKKATTK